MAMRLSALRAVRALLLRNVYFSASDTYFCWRLSKPLALVRLEGLVKLKKYSDVIGFRTRNLPACSTVPQPTTLPPAALLLLLLLLLL
jgi:hypothetical protein